MIRHLVAVLFAIAFAASARAVVPAFPYQPAEPKGPSESRQTIIDAIKADFEKATEQMSKDDPGTDTRTRQARIIAGLNKLLEQEASGYSPKPSSRPDPNETSANPNSPPVTPQPKATKPVAKAGQVAPVDQPMIPQKSPGDWQLPARPRTTADAIPGDRIHERYQELLRAYFSAIARSNQPSERE